MLNVQEISDNWDKLLNIVKHAFSGERQERLLKMYDHFRERMAMTPASARVHYHSCYAGGYVQHILNVYENIRKISSLWESLNPELKDYTDEEMIFVALHHDLGKVGDLDKDCYIPNEEQWSMKRGIMYNSNPDLQFMEHNQRSLYVLQFFDIKIDHKEYLSILLHDGMYVENNKSYLVNYDPNFKVKTSLPFVLHTADMICSESEYWNWKLSEKKKTPLQKIKDNEKPKAVFQPYKKKKINEKLNEDAVNDIASKFKELFK